MAVPKTARTRQGLVRRRQPKLEQLQGIEGDRYVYIEEIDEVWTVSEWDARGSEEGVKELIEHRKQSPHWCQSDKKWWSDIHLLAASLVEMTWSEDHARLMELYGHPTPTQDVVSFELEADA